MQAYNRFMTRRPLLGPCASPPTPIKLKPNQFADHDGDIIRYGGHCRSTSRRQTRLERPRLGQDGKVQGKSRLRETHPPTPARPQTLAHTYQVLDRLPIKSKPALVASRVALDQFAFAPFAVGLFFGTTTLLEGKGVEDVKRKLNDTYKDTLLANWTLFIPFQTINMAFIPLQHRLLAVNAISIPWNAFLSYKASSAVKYMPVAVV